MKGERDEDVCVKRGGEKGGEKVAERGKRGRKMEGRGRKIRQVKLNSVDPKQDSP